MVTSLAVPVVMLLTVLSVLPLSAAAPKLVVYNVVLSSDPPVQAPGIPLELDARIGCAGACCYVVYGTQMKAELLDSENLDMPGGEKVLDLTSPGQPAGTVAAEEGGEVTWIDVHWSISGRREGNLEVFVHVTGTNDFGDRFNLTRSLNITIATISPPVFPHRPVVGRETPVLVDVPSLVGKGSVTLFLSRDNHTWTGLPMERLEGNQWMAAIPAVSAETGFKMYIESLDAYNNSNETKLYDVQVKDPGKLSDDDQELAPTVILGTLAAAGLLFLIVTRRQGRP